MEQKYTYAERLERKMLAANALLDLLATPIVFPVQAPEANNQEKVKEAKRLEEEVEGRRREAQRIKAGIQAQIEHQQRTTGMRVACPSSAPGNSRREGRSDDQDDQNDHQEDERQYLPYNNNNNNNEDKPADEADSDSDDATLSDPGSDAILPVCLACRWRTEDVELDPCPICILTGMKKTRNKRRRDLESQEEELVAKRAATRRERPSNSDEVLDNRDEHLSSDNQNAIQPRPDPQTSEVQNENLQEISNLNIVLPGKEQSRDQGSTQNGEHGRTETEKKTQAQEQIESLAAVSDAAVVGRGDLPSPPFDSTEVGKPSQNGDRPKNAVRETRRASIGIPPIARQIATTEMAALHTQSASEQLHVPTMTNHTTTLSQSRDLLFSVAPNLPVTAFDHQEPTNTVEQSPNKDVPEEPEQTPAPCSKKAYENIPRLRRGAAYSDELIKYLARIEYAREENIPDLEDSDNDIPDEDIPGITRRRIAETPEDDYPEPVDGGDMTLAPEDNVYIGAISCEIKDQTPQEYLEARTKAIWLMEIARLKERHAEILQRAQGDVGNNQACAEKRSPVKHQGDEIDAFPLRQ